MPAARRPLIAACAAAVLLLPTLASAQAPDQLPRQFPEQASRGVPRVTAPPEIQLDGKGVQRDFRFASPSN